MKKDLKFSFDCYFSNEVEFSKCLETLKKYNILPQKIVIGTYFPNNIDSSDIEYKKEFVAFNITNNENEYHMENFPECFVGDISVSMITNHEIKYGDISQIKCDISELPNMLNFLLM